MATVRIVQLVLRQYGISASAIKRLNRGPDAVFKVTAGKRDYVLRFAKTSKTLRAQGVLLAALTGHSAPVPAVIPTKAGKLFTVDQNCSALLLSYVQGEPLGLRISTPVAKAVGKSLGMLHRALSAIGGSSNAPNSLRRATIHADITRENSIRTQGGIVFIDFGDAHSATVVQDLAIASTQLFITRTNGLDLKGLTVFLGAYDGVFPLNRVEAAKVLPLMKKRNRDLIAEFGKKRDASSKSITASARTKLALLSEHAPALRNAIACSIRSARSL